MRSIKLRNTLPEPFAQQGLTPVSEVWLREVTFERGKHYLIEAASGVGKSSLCSFIYGVRRDFRGEIEFDGEDISRLSRHEWISLRRRELSMLFQDLRLFPELTALENVELKNRLTSFRSRADIISLFEELGIADKVASRVEHLSFGQQQRVALVRALCQPLDFILLDEPISHLDAANGAIVAGLLHREASSRGASIIATSIGQHLDLQYDHILKL